MERNAQAISRAPGESVFLPRKVAHVWACVSEQPGKIINVYQPAGQMEKFFREAPKWKGLPSREDVVNNTYTAEQIDSIRRLFGAHGMRVLGPPLIVGMNIQPAKPARSNRQLQRKEDRGY